MLVLGDEERVSRDFLEKTEKSIPIVAETSLRLPA